MFLILKFYRIIGQVAAGRLIDLIGEKPHHITTDSVKIPTRLVIRASTKTGAN